MYEMLRRGKVIQRVKNRKENAAVDFRVQI
jgi:hypothetical protein